MSDQPQPELQIPIPPILAPDHTDSTTDYYTIVQKVGLQQVLPIGPMTPIEGYNGVWPGPTLVATRGRPVEVTQVNQLDHIVVTHNHGSKVPSSSDGEPTAFIQPGASRVYHYPNDQNASTYWLHDHTLDVTSPNIWRGLAMFYIVKDPTWSSLNLPSGAYDIPLLIQDRSFNGDNTLFYPGPNNSDPPDDVPFGDTICVNGACAMPRGTGLPGTPQLNVEARKYLFRLLNGGSTRVLQLYLQRTDSVLGADAPDEPFQVVASDGGLLAAPVLKENLIIAPAERYAIVIDFSRYPVGTSLMMHDYLGVPPDFVRIPDVMTFNVIKTPTQPDTSVVPDTLTTIPRIDPGEAVQTRTVILSTSVGDLRNNNNWTINGQMYDPGRIDYYVKLNTVEIWNIVNDTTFAHTLHLHEVQFQVLAEGPEASAPGGTMTGGTPPPEHQGWKDTVYVPPLTSVTIIVKWTGFPGIYIFHCHMLAHEDHAMMGQVLLQ